jgi:hypothetical protein
VLPVIPRLFLLPLLPLLFHVAVAAGPVRTENN